MPDFAPSNPEKEQVTLCTLDETGVEISNFTEYSFNAGFLTPTDGWSFTIAAERLSEQVRKEILRLGAYVAIKIGGRTQSSGIVDSIEVSASRSGGTEYRIEGRDYFGQVVDSCADPTKAFKTGQNLHDCLRELFGPFGWANEDQFEISNDANRDAQSGGIRGVPMTKGGKKKGPHPLKSFTVHQVQPYPKEGVFEFASRMANRFGLWIWPSADGEKVIVGRPDFTTPPNYQLRRNNAGTTNVLDGSVKYDIGGQPTMMIAEGRSQNAQFGSSPLKSFMVNTAVFTEDPAFIHTWLKHKDAHRVDGHAHDTPMKMPYHRPVWLRDTESQTQEQLDNFLRREMALVQRRSLQIHYTVEGHGQMNSWGFTPWALDHQVQIADDIAGLHGVFYLLSVTFNKSRSGGTTTRLELIRPHTINFGEPIKPMTDKPADYQKKRVREHAIREEQETFGTGRSLI